MAATGPDRAHRVRQAFRFEWLTVGWIALEAVVGLAAGIQAGSLVLLAFGLDSLIELGSAATLIWRLSVELQRGAAFSERAEHVASRIAGGLLFALAAYIVVSAAWSLATRHGAAFSVPGLVVSVLAIPIMVLLGRRKRVLADGIGSRALRADAAESVACAWLAGTVVVSLVAEGAFGVWWIDPVASLAVVWFVVREGREAWEGEACGCA